MIIMRADQIKALLAKCHTGRICTFLMLVFRVSLVLPGKYIEWVASSTNPLVTWVVYTDSVGKHNSHDARIADPLHSEDCRSPTLIHTESFS